MEQIRRTLSRWVFFATMFGSKVFFGVDFYQNNKCVFDFYSHNFHKIFFKLYQILVGSQIWLNNFLDDHHISYITKFEKEKDTIEEGTCE
jgi:hypothetical protein